MARQGYVSQIKFGPSVDFAALARLCKVDAAAQKDKLDQTLAAILELAEHLVSDSQIMFVPDLDRINELDGKDDWTVDEAAEYKRLRSIERHRRFVMTVEIDWGQKLLRFRFNDEKDGVEMPAIEMAFSNIEAALRLFTAELRSYGNNWRGKVFAMHLDVLRSMGLGDGASFSESPVAIEHHGVRFFGLLVYALFPAGPSEDWQPTA